MSKPKFKAGPAKLRNGLDAYIFEVSENRIFGKIRKLDGWMASSWGISGNIGANVWPQELDLLPNLEPYRWEGKVRWADWAIGGPVLPILNEELSESQKGFPQLVGRKGTLVFTEDLEE